MPTDWYDLGLKPAEWKIYFNGENLSEEIKESMGTIVTKHHLNTKQLERTDNLLRELKKNKKKTMETMTFSKQHFLTIMLKYKLENNG